MAKSKKSTENVLLVYVLTPETCRIAWLPNLDAALVAKLRKIHHTYVNGDDMTDAQHAAHAIVNKNLGPNGIWAKSLVGEKPLDVESGSFVVIEAGFIL